MSEADRDIAALFAAEAPPAPDPGFVARVAGDIAAARRRRMWVMSAAGLTLGLGAGLALALAAPFMEAAAQATAQAVQLPGVNWAVMAGGLLLAIGVPLYRAR